MTDAGLVAAANALGDKIIGAVVVFLILKGLAILYFGRMK